MCVCVCVCDQPPLAGGPSPPQVSNVELWVAVHHPRRVPRPEEQLVLQTGTRLKPLGPVLQRSLLSEGFLSVLFVLKHA